MAASGYSRRFPPGERSTDRRRLLVDRDAYIAYLEAEAERRGEVAVEVEALSSGLREVGARVGDLEDAWRESGSLLEGMQSRVSDAAERVLRLEGETARVETALQAFESRLQRVDQAMNEARAAADAEIARARNELTLSTQEMGERLESRMHDLRAFADEGATSVIREAQVTCVRLADDALGAAEASQRKLEEFQRRTEASFEVLRVDVTSLRAEVAGASMAAPLAPTVVSPPVVTGIESQSTATTTAAALADELESRLSARLGQQILHLSEALRRVVRAQAALSRRVHVPGSDPADVAGGGCEAYMPDVKTSMTARSASGDDVGLPFTKSPDGVAAGSTSTVLAPASAPALVSDRGRARAAIEDLYRELRALEQDDNASSALPCRGSRRVR